MRSLSILFALYLVGTVFGHRTHEVEERPVQERFTGSCQNEKYLAAATSLGRLFIWAFGRSRTPVFEVKASSFAVRGCCFSPDGEQVTTLSDHEVKVWNLQTTTQLFSLVGHTARVSSCSYYNTTEEMKLLTSSIDKRLLQWRLPDQSGQDDEEILVIQPAKTVEAGHWVEDFCITPDDRVVSVGLHGELILWDAELTKQEATTKATVPLVAIACSPKGSQTASIGPSSQLHVWDYSNNSLQIAPLQGQPMTYDTCYSTEDMIYSLSRGGAIQKWNASNLLPLPVIGRPFMAPMQGGTSFSSDCKRAILVGSRIWIWAIFESTYEEIEWKPVLREPKEIEEKIKQVEIISQELL